MCVFICIAFYLQLVLFSDYTDLSLVNHPYCSLGGNKIKNARLAQEEFGPLSVLVSCHFSKAYLFSS